MNLQILLPEEKITEFCQRHHIYELALFGSVLRDDFRPESDIDMLVKFEPEHTPGWDFFEMEAELSRILQRKVDLHTPNFLSHYFRRQVLQEARILYAKS